MEWFVHIEQIPVNSSHLVCVQVLFSFPSSSIKEGGISLETRALLSLMLSFDLGNFRSRIKAQIMTHLPCSPVTSEMSFVWILV